MRGAVRQGFVSVIRDLRGGELRVLVAAVTLAVAAMTAVGFFTDRVEQVVVMRSAEVLAADLVIRSNRPISDLYLREASASGLQVATGTSFPSVVVAGDSTALVDVEAVSEKYPLRGQLRTSDTPFGESLVASSVPQPGEAWADAKLLARLGESPGVTVALGDARLTITRVLDYRPDQGFSFVDLAPTLLINERDVPATGLIQPGSRVSYKQLFAGDRDAITDLRAFVVPRLGVSERIRDLSDAGPEIRNALTRAQRFLGLAALVGTLLAAVAVAMAASRYAGRQIDTVALMKSFGARESYVLKVSLAQLATIAATSALAGVILGYGAQAGLAMVLTDLAGSELPAPGWRPALGGAALAAVVLAGFALPSLVAVRRVPPLRVLRRDLSAPPPSAWTVYGAAAVSIVGLLFWQVGDAVLAGWLVLGLLVLLLVLAVCAALLVIVATRIRGSAGAAWRYALAGLARRRTSSVVQVVAFGLGIMVLLLLTLVRTDLLVEWRAALPEDAPNRFLINIQPDEVQQVTAFLEDRVGEAGLVPLVRARLTEINGEILDIESLASERGRQLADREANLSSNLELQEDNSVVQGTWWSDSSAATGQVSVEVEFARDLGINLGDRLGFDVAGEQFTADVTSLRTVQWDSFRPNFFMLFSPGTLDPYPTTHIGSIHVTPQNGADLLELIRKFPSVTVIDIDAILGQIRRVMDQAATAVQYVFLFSLAAGVLVLLAVVDAGRDERLYESALLRSLGARRSQVLSAALIEFSLLGVLAGTLAAGGALVTGTVIADRVFQLDFDGNPWLWLAGLMAGLVLVGGSGFLATRTVVTHSPVAVLRRF